MPDRPDVFLCSPGYESPLESEIGGTVTRPVPGVVVAAAARLERTDHLFARQVLPAAVEVRAPSVSRLAAGAFDSVLPSLDSREEAWRLDVIVPDEPLDANLPGELRRRADLVRTAFLAVAKKRRRRVFRRLATAGAPLAVQLLLADRELLFASAAAPVALPRGGFWPSPFPAGIAPVPDDPAAPSRAYRKLLEALAWLGRGIGPGDEVVDLGAAPGGWTRVALESGASRVVAVDRAELDPRILADPRVVHLRRTAHTWDPPDPPADWLLADVIAFPDAGLRLLGRWIEHRWARNLVFHLKFRGREDYGPAREARRLLLAAPFDLVRAKHLSHDRNEITLMAAETQRSDARRTSIDSPASPAL